MLVIASSDFSKTIMVEVGNVSICTKYKHEYKDPANGNISIRKILYVNGEPMGAYTLEGMEIVVDIIMTALQAHQSEEAFNKLKSKADDPSSLKGVKVSNGFMKDDREVCGDVLIRLIPEKTNAKGESLDTPLYSIKTAGYVTPVGVVSTGWDVTDTCEEEAIFAKRNCFERQFAYSESLEGRDNTFNTSNLF